MINAILAVLVMLMLLDVFGYVENFKNQIGEYNVCADCGEAPRFCKGCEDGEWVKYKYPHYYGYGGWGYSYGEPFYYRNMKNLGSCSK